MEKHSSFSFLSTLQMCGRLAISALACIEDTRVDTASKVREGQTCQLSDASNNWQLCPQDRSSASCPMQWQSFYLQDVYTADYTEYRLMA